MLERLKQFRDTIGFTQQKMADALGIKRNTYSLIEKGERSLTDRHIESLENKLNLNREWLLTGEGNMFSDSKDLKEFLDLYDSLTPESQKYLMKQARILQYMEQHKDK